MAAPVYPIPGMGRVTRALFDVLSFCVAHIFLWPVAALALEAAAAAVGGMVVGVVLLAANAVYATTYWSNATATGSRFWPAFCSIWLGCHQYFPVRTLMWDGGGYADHPVPAHDAIYDVRARTYVFGMHPHGAIPVGGALLRPQISRWPVLNEFLRVGVATAVFVLPLVRDFYLWFGSVLASKRVLVEQLRRGKSVLLLVGGIREQLWVCKPGEDVVILRDGFIRLALESGSALVPMYVFGERRGYVVQHTATKVCSGILRRLFRVGIPLVRGRWWLTLMPFPVPITITIGAPIDVPRRAPDAPPVSDADVAAYVVKYETALRALYDTHKDACGYGDTALVIRHTRDDRRRARGGSDGSATPPVDDGGAATPSAEKLD